MERMPVEDYNTIVLPESKGFTHWELPGNRRKARTSAASASSTSTSLTSIVVSEDSDDDSEFEHEELDEFMRKHGIEPSHCDAETTGGDNASTSNPTNPTKSTCSVRNGKGRVVAAPHAPGVGAHIVPIQRSPSVSSINSSLSKRSSEHSNSDEPKRRRHGVSIFHSRFVEVHHA